MMDKKSLYDTIKYQIENNVPKQYSGQLLDSIEGALNFYFEDTEAESNQLVAYLVKVSENVTQDNVTPRMETYVVLAKNIADVMDKMEAKGYESYTLQFQRSYEVIK